jgi:hypothetical protein
MSYEAEHAAIESRFDAYYGGTEPVKYDNVPFAPPKNGAYLELQIHDGDAFPASIGDGILERSVGIISVNIYSPISIGSRQGVAIADNVAAIFRHANFSGIQCRSPVIRRLGEIDKKFVINVSTAFYRDEIF